MLETQIAIPSVPELKNACILQKLAGGPTSGSWLISLGAAKAVLRMDNPLARLLGLDRVAELKVLEQVADAGFGPAVVWACPTEGILVTDYIFGRHWTIADARRPENIERLAIRLRELHSSPIKGPVLDIAEAAARYATVAGTPQANELHIQVLATLRHLGSELSDWSFCHNDLGYRNIVDTGSLMFVDWEYAASGHSLFDLAGIVQQNGLSCAQANQLQRTYFGASAAKPRGRMRLYIRLHELVAELWNQAVCAANFTTLKVGI